MLVRVVVRGAIRAINFFGIDSTSRLRAEPMTFPFLQQTKSGKHQRDLFSRAALLVT